MPLQVTEEIAALYVATYRAAKDADVVPQAFQLRPTTAVLNAKGRIQFQTAGRMIVVDLDKELNPTAQWTDPADGTVSIEKHDPLSENQFKWALLTASVWARHIHATQAAGPAQRLSLQKAFLNNVKETMAEKMEDALWTAQTGHAPYSLVDLVPVTPSSGTIGIINRATYPWYRSTSYSCSGRAFSTYGADDMRQALLTVLRWGARIEDIVIFADQTAYALYDAEVLEQKRIVDKSLGDLAFEMIAYRGRPMICCYKAPAGTMRWVDTSRLKFYVNSLVNMELGNFIPSQTSLDLVAHLAHECQLVDEKPNAHELMHTIAA